MTRFLRMAMQEQNGTPAGFFVAKTSEEIQAYLKEIKIVGYRSDEAVTVDVIELQGPSYIANELKRTRQNSMRIRPAMGEHFEAQLYSEAFRAEAMSSIDVSLPKSEAPVAPYAGMSEAAAKGMWRAEIMAMPGPG